MLLQLQPLTLAAFVYVGLFYWFSLHMAVHIMCTLCVSFAHESHEATPTKQGILPPSSVILHLMLCILKV